MESPILLPTNCDYNLSGVVIHTGTADSGHYYSLINDEKKNQWIEFNDTTIRSFDLKNLASEAYGGEDKTPSTLSTTNIKLNVEKCRNAYLLFYKRKEFFNNANSYEISASNNHLFSDGPKNNRKEKVLMKRPHFLEDIQNDNEKYYLKKYVFHPNFSQFIINLSHLIVSWSPKQKSFFEICRLLFNYFISVLIRSKDRENLPLLYKNLKEILKISLEVSNWFILQLANKDILVEILIDCPFREIKSLLLGLIKRASQVVAQLELDYDYSAFKSKSSLLRILTVCLKLLSETEDRKKSMGQFYEIFPLIIVHSPNCKRFLFKERILKRLWNYLSNLVEFNDIISLETNTGELNPTEELKQNIKDKFSNNNNKILSFDEMREKKKDKSFYENTPVNFSGLIQFWCELALSIKMRSGDTNGVVSPENAQMKLVLSEHVWRKMLQELRNEETKKKIRSFFCFISLKSFQTSQELINLMFNEIGDLDETDLPLIWGVIDGIVGINDEYQEVRCTLVIKNFFNSYFKNNMDFYRCIDIGLEWILKVRMELFYRLNFLNFRLE